MAYKARGIEGLGPESKKTYEGLIEEAKTLNDEISRYEMGVESGASAEPSEELALMEALAKRSYQESQSLQPSNIAAQFAMVLDPTFAPIYKDATTRHVNAARQYFGDLGAIARESRSEKSARASSRKRSDARLKSVLKRIEQFERAAADADRSAAADWNRVTVANIGASSKKTRGGKEEKLIDTVKRKREFQKDLLNAAKVAKLPPDLELLRRMEVKGFDYENKSPEQIEAIRMVENLTKQINYLDTAARLAGNTFVTGAHLQAAVEGYNPSRPAITVTPTSRRTNEAWKARQKARRKALGQKSNSQ